MEHVDVLIVGAGLSGIGAAHHLQDRLPHKTLRDLRGARRDRRHVGPVPLPGRALGLGHVHARLPVPAVDGRQGDRRRPVDPRLRARDRARGRDRPPDPLRPPRRAAPRGRRADARWTVDGRGREPDVTCDFLYVCGGYYRYDEGYLPEFAGVERFAGQIVHPQFWPEDLDYAGKRVVVDRQRRDRGHARPGAGRAGRARDDAAALADLHPLDPVRGPDRERRCGGCSAPRAAYPIARWKNVAHLDAGLPAQPAPPEAHARR